MPTNTVNASSSSQPSITNTDSWQNAQPTTSWRGIKAFIPRTSYTWEGKPMCRDISDLSDHCCCPKSELKGTIEMAYDEGFGDHPGVHALENLPCTPCVDVDSLDSQLMEQLRNNTTSEDAFYAKHHIPGTPKTLDTEGRLSYVTGETLDYCKNVVRNVISHHFGNLDKIPQKETLGESFEKVRNYCTDLVFRHFKPLEVITNKIPEGN